MKFAEYSGIMAAPTLVAGAVSLLMLYAIFRKHFTATTPSPTDVNPTAALLDVSGAIFGSVSLLACLFMLSIAPLLNLPMWVITLVFAVVYAARNVWVYPWDLRQPSVSQSIEPSANLQAARDQQVVDMDELVATEGHQVGGLMDEDVKLCVFG
jgi:H+/Cl- antiporter ClcA